MSLFGGDHSDPQSPTSYDDDDSVSFAGENPSRSTCPQNAESPPLVSFSLDSNQESSSEDEFEGPRESDEEPSRSNRFIGHPQTWRRYTAEDRQIAASLENIESADLAAHLYNAHSLKRRVRRPAEQLEGVKNWQGKSTWQRKGKDLEFTNPLGDLETELVPTKRWTAWPLPPARLPVKGIGNQHSDSDEDAWHIGASTTQDVGDVMREEMLALFMRQAKKHWQARESVQKDKRMQSKRKARVKSEREDVRSERSQAAMVDSEQSISDIEMREVSSIGKGKLSPSESEPEDKFANIIGNKRGRRRQQLPSAKPAFLADDDAARRILQPSINSVLARLDSLALAVRRNKFNHFGRGANSDRSGSEFTSDAGSAMRRSKSLSRSQSKGQPIRRVSKPTSRVKRTSKPKPAILNSKTEPLRNTDSASDYGADHEPESVEESNSSDNDPRTRAGTGRKRPRRSSDSSVNSEGDRKVGLMDWSEILSLASISGWDERAVARTAQRCAALFNEGMGFRMLDESHATEAIPLPVHYTPSTIPAPDDLGTEAPVEVRKRPYFNIGTLRCPHVGCWGSEQDFKIPYRTVEHVTRIHGYDPRTNDSDNEERTVGGVHIHGYLQPITVKQGWLGNRRSKSRERKPGKGSKKPKLDNEPSSPMLGEHPEL